MVRMYSEKNVAHYHLNIFKILKFKKCLKIYNLLNVSVLLLKVGVVENSSVSLTLYKMKELLTYCLKILDRE